MAPHAAAPCKSALAFSSRGAGSECWHGSRPVYRQLWSLCRVCGNLKNRSALSSTCFRALRRLVAERGGVLQTVFCHTSPGGDVRRLTATHSGVGYGNGGVGTLKSPWRRRRRCLPPCRLRLWLEQAAATPPSAAASRRMRSDRSEDEQRARGKKRKEHVSLPIDRRVQTAFSSPQPPTATDAPHPARWGL